MFKKGYIPWNKGGTSWNKGRKAPWAAANGFKKGQVAWNKGLHWSQETIDKIKVSKKGQVPWMKGKKHTKKAKRIIGEKALGRVSWNKGTIGIMKPNSGSFIAGTMLGKKHPNWNGGSSKLPYAYTFTTKLKQQIKERDDFICLLCQTGDDLVIHHIDYNKMNCDQKNLVTLCRSHNSIVNSKRKFWEAKIKKLLRIKKNEVNSMNTQKGQH